jgi:hypothetical protein
VFAVERPQDGPGLARDGEPENADERGVDNDANVLEEARLEYVFGGLEA